MTRRVRAPARGVVFRALVTALALTCAAPARADRVLTTDGRVLAPKKARVEGAGYRLEFENGTIVLADKSLVASAEIEGDMSDYVPANDDEREKLAQGYVKYRGRWVKGEPPARWIVRWTNPAGRPMRDDHFGENRAHAIARARSIARKFGVMAVAELAEPTTPQGEPT